MLTTATDFDTIDRWVDAHFDAQVRFLQALVRIPTDTPPGDNAPHAERTAELLDALGLYAERHPVPPERVHAQGMQSITNLIVRQRFGPGRTVALNAHGDAVPPGPGWTHDPYGGDIVAGKLYGRGAAVSKSDFATYAYALLALKALGVELAGSVELHFTYDEEFGGELGPGWLLEQDLTRPDLLIAAGFSYEVVTAHNGCLQLEVTVHGRMAHAAVPQTGVDALQAAIHILQTLYVLNTRYAQIKSGIAGIDHPYLNVGTITGGTNTNVVPGEVMFRLDRRMIPEEDPVHVEAEIRAAIASAAASCPGVRVDLRRLLLAASLKPHPESAELVRVIQRHARTVFGATPPECGTPLYTDVRLYGAREIPAVIYGAGPHTILESNAKRADENLALDDLRRATKVVARSLLDLLRPQA